MKKLYAFLAGVVLALGLLLLLWCAALYHWGTTPNGFRYLRGYNYVVFPTRIDVGDGVRGETRMTSTTVRNFSFSPIRVVGVVTTCNCLTVTGLPLTIEPGQSRELGLRVYLESASGAVEQLAKILIDDGQVETAPLVITGTCFSSKGS